MSKAAGTDAVRSGPGPWVVGASFGAAHAFAETSSLGVLGLGLGLRDVVVLSATTLVAGALAAAVMALILRGGVRSVPNRRAAVSAGLCLAELGLAVELGALSSRLGILLWSLGVLAALVTVVAEASSRVAPWTRLGLHLAVTAGACTATMAGDIPRLGLLTLEAEPTFRGLLIAGVAVPLVLALGLVALRPGPRGAVGLLPLAGLAALPSLLYSSVLPLPLRSHLRQREAVDGPDLTRPDVVFVVLDTVRSDRLELFGHDRVTMPALARFAREECVVCMDSLATAPSSLPSHASMFSGQYSTRHGGHKAFLDHLHKAREGLTPPAPAYAYSIRRDAPMLAEQLRAAGYQTAGFAANFGVLGAFGLERGYEHYDVAPGAPYIGRRATWIGKWRLFGRKPGGLIDRLLPESFARRTVLFTDREPDYRRAEEINAQARRWLRTRDEDRPTYLFLNYFDAHDPYLPVPELDGHFMDEPEGLPWVGFPKTGYNELLEGRRAPSPQEIEWMKAQYDAEMLYLDGQLEEMFDHLRESGRWENSLVVVTSDHGEGFWEHGFLRHSTTLYQTQVGVPMLIKLPGQAAPIRPVPEHFQSIDLLPTILDVLGLPIPDELDGSVWAADREAAVAEVFCHHPETERLNREMKAVVRGRLKYIMRYEALSGDVREEAYDLVEDPEEQHDLLNSPGAPDVQELREIAEALFSEREEALERWLRDGGGDSSQAMLDRLEAMGYMEKDER